MKKTILVATIFLFLSEAFAVSGRVDQILNKNNRQLPNPPRALRSDQADKDLRYASGNRRIQYAANNKDLEEVPVDGVNMPVMTPIPTLTSERTFNRRTKSRNFGLAFVGAGAYGIFGAEANFGVTDDWSFGFGMGTGMSYSTWGAHTRYFFRRQRLTPFVQLGYANWYLGKTSPSGRPILPNYIAERFFPNQDGNYISGTYVHILYPGIGVTYLHPDGIGISAQLQYMIHMRGFTGALNGAFGVHYYF